MISLLKGKPKEQMFLAQHRRTQEEANARQASMVQDLKNKMAEMDRCAAALQSEPALSVRQLFPAVARLARALMLRADCTACRRCRRRNKEREQAHAEALKQLEEATKQAEYRKRIANDEILKARKREEKAVGDLNSETGKLDPLKKSVEELRAKVDSLQSQLKAADLRTDDMALKLSQERNRLLQLKFKNTMGVDVGALGPAGSEGQGGVVPQSRGDAAMAQARQERQHIKRLVDFFKHKLAADLEAWRRAGCAGVRGGGWGGGGRRKGDEGGRRVGEPQGKGAAILK
jgi:uncharacterized protein YoxC